MPAPPATCCCAIATLCDGPALAKCLDCAGRHYGAAKALIAVAGVRSGRPLLRRTVRGIHSVSRFVEQTVWRDLLGDDLHWEPILERIPDVVPLPGPDGPAVLTAAEQALVDRLPSQPFILFVGALQAHKGLVVLLEAYRRMGADARATCRRWCSSARAGRKPRPRSRPA